MKNLKPILNQENVSIIDVRSPWEYQEAHVRGAVNIPLEEIPAHISELKKRNGPLVLYCRSGNRSNIAMQMLKQAGIPEIYNGGGLTDMQKMILN